MKKDNMLLDYEGSWALIYSELSFLAMSKCSDNILNMENSCTVSIGENRYYRVYLKEHDLKKNQERALSLFYDSVSVKKCIKNIKRIIEEMKEFEICNNKDSMLKLFSKYCDLCERYLFYYNTISASRIYDKVWEHLHNIIPQSYYFAINEIKNALMASNYEILLTNQEVYCWTLLCEKYLNDNLKDTDIEEHIKKFLSLYDTTGKKNCYTHQILKEQLSNITFQELNGLKTRCENVKMASNHNEDWASRTFKRICHNKEDYIFVRNLSVFPVLRLLMREAYQRLKLYATQTFLGIIMEQINSFYGFAAFDYLLIDEIKLYLNNNILPDSKEIYMRQSKAVFIYCNNNIYFNEGENILKDLHFPKVVQTKVLKGISVSSRGKKILKVKKIIQDKNGEEKLSLLSKEKELEGFVLVSNTIRPYMIHLCMKIGGLILTEGSMTSHASVLCRELGIPCVIGVENAIDTLEDGQIVAIDFETGIIQQVSDYKEKMPHSAYSIVKFGEDESLNLHLVGGKAANLQKISDIVRIPKGFIISTWGSQIICSNNESDVLELKTHVKNCIKQLNASNLAIRSSHEEEDGIRRSLAGVFDSFTNISADNFSNVWDNILKVIASTKRIKVTGVQNMAVIIQEMIKADISGVIITSKPYGGYDYMLIEYTYGDLAKLMDGMVKPFRIYVKKVHLLDGGPLSEVCLPALVEENERKAFDELGKMALKIEKRFASPVEIEWGIMKGIPYIFQARTY